MTYRSLPLNGLRAFEAAARHGSFKQAADKLFVTPTAVSHQIKALEDSLGVQLFHRLTRALALTADGETLLPKVSEGLKCLKAAVDLRRAAPEVTILSVTAPPTFAARWLVPRLTAFNQAHPEVELHLSSSFKMIDVAKRSPRSPVDVVETDGGTSIAVRFGYGHYKDCRVDRIFAADYFPMCSPSLLRSKRPLRVPQDLRWHVLLHDETIPDEAIRPTWEKWFKVAGVTGVKPHHGPRFRDVSLALEAACDGQGLVLAMEPVARREIEAGRLVIPFCHAPARAPRLLSRGSHGRRRTVGCRRFPRMVARRSGKGGESRGSQRNRRVVGTAPLSARLRRRYPNRAPCPRVDPAGEPPTISRCSAVEALRSRGVDPRRKRRRRERTFPSRLNNPGPTLAEGAIMTDHELAQRALEVLAGPPYFNVATESDGQPWNSPVWAARDDDLNLYWSSWIKAVHSLNLASNPRAFLTIFDSTRRRGTNNRRCLYLQCTAVEVSDPAEASKAFALLYPDEPADLTDFLGPGQKRFYRATPLKAWLNCLSERELTPSTVKMREEVSLALLKAAT